MKTKTLTAIVAIAALSFVSACGTSGGSDGDAKKDDATTTAAPKATTTTEADTSVAVDEWAADFCGNFSSWLDDIKSASSDVGSQVTPGDIDSAKTAISGLFESASQSTQELITAMEEGGSPDIEDGDQLVDDLIEKFQAFDEAAQTAKSETEALATEDVATFQADAEKLTTTFQEEVNTVADSFSEIDAKYPSQDLNEALSSSCNF